MSQIFANLNPETLQHLQNTAKTHVIVLKFTAKWCGPCNKIKGLVASHFKSLPNNVIIFELDIDMSENVQLYTLLKSKRQIRGIPGLLSYYGDVDRPFWFVPDDCVNSSNTNAINNFFSNVKNRAAKLLDNSTNK